MNKDSANKIIGDAVNTTAKKNKPPLLKQAFKDIGGAMVAMGKMLAVGIGATLGFLAITVGTVGSLGLLATVLLEADDQDFQNDIKRLQKIFDMLTRNMKSRDKLFAKIQKMDETANESEVNKVSSEISKQTQEQIDLGSEMIEIMNKHGDRIINDINAKMKSKRKAKKYLSILSATATAASQGKLTTDKDIAKNVIKEDFSFDSSKDIKNNTEGIIANILNQNLDNANEMIREDMRQRMNLAVEARRKTVASKIYES